MTFLDVFGVILLGAFLAGGASGLLGVFVIGLRIPFLVMCTAHTALAGAVFAQMTGHSPSLGAFLGAILGSTILGWLLRNRKIDINVALGTLFSLSMGLVFLGIGLTTGPKTQALGLLWGNLLFLTPRHVAVLAAVTILLVAFILIFQAQLKVLLFDRALAEALIQESILLALLLVLASGIIAICLGITGGLMLYALISNPAIAALRIARSWRNTFLLSAFFGSFSALGGFFTAYWLNLPLGACIVLTSSVVVCLSFLYAALPDAKEETDPENDGHRPLPQEERNCEHGTC